MEDSPTLQPKKKRRPDSDVRLCIICKEYNTKKIIVDRPNNDTLQKVLDICRERHKYKDSSVQEFVQRTSGCTGTNLHDTNAFYHRECYQQFGNADKLARVKSRFEKTLKQGSSTATKRKAGRPAVTSSTIATATSVDAQQLRSQSGTYHKECCIICLQPYLGKDSRKVAHLEMGASMLNVARKLAEPGFFIRMNSISSASDAVANDVMYHLHCWVIAKRNAHETDKSVEVPESTNVTQVIADIELVNLVDIEIRDPTLKVLDMNTINEKYKELLVGNGIKGEELKVSYKRYLKQLILDNVDNVSFQKSKRVNKPEQICNTSAEREAINIALTENNADRFHDIFKVAKQVRTEIQGLEKWSFTGSFSDFPDPLLLSTLIRWILVGPHELVTHAARKTDVDHAVSSVTQLLVQSFRSQRQLMYKPVHSTNREMNQTRETPLSVGIGQLIHQKTCSKELIDTLNHMNLSISYDKVLTLKRGIASSVREKMRKNDSVYVPVKISQNRITYYTIDNTDLKIDTADGKRQLHSTAMAVYQENTGVNTEQPLSIPRTSSASTSDCSAYDVVHCPEPFRQTKKYAPFAQKVDRFSDAL